MSASGDPLCCPGCVTLGEPHCPHSHKESKVAMWWRRSTGMVGPLTRPVLHSCPTSPPLPTEASGESAPGSPVWETPARAPHFKADSILGPASWRKLSSVSRSVQSLDSAPMCHVHCHLAWLCHYQGTACSPRPLGQGAVPHSCPCNPSPPRPPPIFQARVWLTSPSACLPARAPQERVGTGSGHRDCRGQRGHAARYCDAGCGTC